MKLPLLLLSLATLCVSALEMRVKIIDGVALLCQDGKPVRSRMFWGGPSTAAINIPAGARRIDIIRQSFEDFDGNLTFHFRFQKQTSRVLFTDFSMTDLDTGELVVPPMNVDRGQEDYQRHFRQWPFPSQTADYAKVSLAEGKGPDGRTAVQIAFNCQPNKTYPDFHLFTTHRRIRLQQLHTYRLSLWVHSDCDTSLIFCGYEPPRTPGGMYTQKLSDSSFQSQVHLAAKAGVDIISVPISLVWPDETSPAYDFTAIDGFLQSIINMNPRAKLLVRVNVNPPPHWTKLHPDELIGWDSAVAAKHSPFYSVSSRVWREAMLKHLAALIDHLEAKFPEHMAGYHPGGQNTSEWFYKDSWSNNHHGFGPAEIQAFRHWLSRKYRTDQALQASWNQADVSLANAMPPSVERRENAPGFGIWLLPLLCQDILDFHDFLQDEMTDAITLMAAVIRKHTQGRKLSVFFYGYGYEFCSFSRPSASGHLALRRLLNDPNIDILCSPISYNDRQQGGAAHAMTAAESVQLAGKIWLYEDDTATHLHTGKYPGWREKVKTSEESRHLLVRNTAQEICRNIACWWMDLGRAGWFNDPDFWLDMKALNRMEQPLLEQPKPYRPVIASVLDETSQLYVRHGHMVGRPLTYEGRAQLARSGTSFGQFLLDDLLAQRLDSPVVLLHNAWLLTQTQRQQLQKALANKAVIWGYAVAPLDPTSSQPLPPEQLEQLSGFHTVPLSQLPATCTVQSTDLGRRLGLPDTWSLPRGLPVPPVLYTVKLRPAQQVLATWPDGSPAVVLDQSRRRANIFCGIPSTPHQLLRASLKLNGLRPLTNDDCALYTQPPFIMVHANHDGPVTLTFTKKSHVSEVLTGRSLGKNLTQLTFELKFGETKLIRLDEP